MSSSTMTWAGIWRLPSVRFAGRFAVLALAFYLALYFPDQGALA